MKGMWQSFRELDDEKTAFSAKQERNKKSRKDTHTKDMTRAYRAIKELTEAFEAVDVENPSGHLWQHHYQGDEQHT
jgi:hypothetical protein